MKGPLNGIRVVECASQQCPLPLRLAMSFTGRMAADLGAEVHKTSSSGGDPVAAVAPIIGGSSALSAFLDLHKITSSCPEGRDPVSMLRDSLRDSALPTPDILLCDSTAFSQLGDYAAGRVRTVLSMTPGATDAPASEFTVMASSGLLDLVGEPEREPLKMGGRQLAYSCGLSAYAASIAALSAQRNDPAGANETVRVCLADVGVWLNWKSVAMAAWSGSGKSRLGRDAEWQVLRCADGWVALVYLEADWPVLRELVDDARLADPRYDDRVQRRRDARHISMIVEQKFLSMTRRQLKDLALQKRLPLGPVWTPLELETDPHNSSRNFFSRINAADGTPLLMPRLPVLWNGAAMPQVPAGAAA